MILYGRFLFCCCCFCTTFWENLRLANFFLNLCCRKLGSNCCWIGARKPTKTIVSKNHLLLQTYDIRETAPKRTLKISEFLPNCDVVYLQFFLRWLVTCPWYKSIYIYNISGFNWYINYKNHTCTTPFCSTLFALSGLSCEFPPLLS